MKVKDLICELKKMPPDAEMGYIWDGCSRGECNLVWLSRGGRAIICDYNEVVYDDEDRPLTAPTEKQDHFWRTPAQSKNN